MPLEIRQLLPPFKFSLILLGFYWLIIKLTIIRDTFELRNSIGTTSDIKKSLPQHQNIWDNVYFYRYGHTHLTYLPWIFMSKLFLWKKYGSEVLNLPTVWTYVQTFVFFFNANMFMPPIGQTSFSWHYMDFCQHSSHSNPFLAKFWPAEHFSESKKFMLRLFCKKLINIEIELCQWSHY